MFEDEDLLHAAEYALSIVRRTEELATADGLGAEYQAALVTLTAYVQALHREHDRPRPHKRELDGY
jgi:hypothetical protein